MKIELKFEGAAALREDLRALQKRLTSSYTPVLERIANHFRDSIVTRMRAGISPPLTETSVKLRGGESTPLVGGTGPIGKHGNYGSLIDNLKPFSGAAVAGVEADFRAVFHQFGFTTSEKSAIPGKRVPARPFITLSKEDGDWALNELAEFLFEEKHAA